MRLTGRLTRMTVCVLTLAVGVASYPVAAQSQGGGDSSTLASYAVKKGDIDSATVRAVASNPGIGQHIEIQTAEGKRRGRIVRIGEHSYRAEADGEIREVGYQKTKAFTRKMSTRNKVLVGVAIAGTVLVAFLIWHSNESAN